MAWTATTAAVDTDYEDGIILSLPMVDNKIIYKGDLVRITAEGYASGSSTAPATGDMFIGMALETVDNTKTGHATGGKSVRVVTEGTVEVFKGTAAITDLGCLAYNSVTVDAQTVDVSAGTHACLVGAVVGLVYSKDKVADTTKLRIKLISGANIAT
jgi:hypothetical protein